MSGHDYADDITARYTQENPRPRLECGGCRQLERDLAAAVKERDALQRRVEELELYIKAEDNKKQPASPDGLWTYTTTTTTLIDEKREYRDRLDRMVAALCTNPLWDNLKWESCVEQASDALAAIDALIAKEERK